MNIAYALKANFSLEEDMSGVRGVTIFPINPIGKEDEPTFYTPEALWSLKCLIDELEGELNISEAYNKRMQEWAGKACESIKYRIAEKISYEDIVGNEREAADEEKIYQHSVLAKPQGLLKQDQEKDRNPEEKLNALETNS